MTALAAVAVGCSSTERVETLPVHRAEYGSWAEIFADPQPVSVLVWNTGMIKADMKGLLNPKRPDSPEWNPRRDFVDVPVVLAQSEENGIILFDTGLNSSAGADSLKYVRGMLKSVIIDEMKQEKGQAVSERLNELGMAPDYVFFTHLHFDHIGGAADLPSGITYVRGKDEREIRVPMLFDTEYLAHIRVFKEIDFTKAQSIPPFEQVVDIFGDSSVFAINTAGHTKGHVSFLINALQGPLFVAGDALNIPENVETGIGPGRYSWDMKMAQEKMDAILGFLAMYPDVKLQMGHYCRETSTK